MSAVFNELSGQKSTKHLLQYLKLILVVYNLL